MNSVGVSVENLVSSESRIRDADIAKVSAEMISRQIMQQAGVAVLAHPLYYDRYERLLPTLGDMGIAGFEAS